MLREVAIGSLLVCLLAVGCEKKEPEPAPPEESQPQARAPAGMVPVLTEPGKSVYISQTPVTVGEYVEYLRATDQPAPPRWQGLQPGDPAADAPITGLTREETELLAAWNLARVPSREEWQDWLDAELYPWSPDGRPVPGAPIYLVRDWELRSEGEREARARKEELPQKILARYQEEVNELRDRLKSRADELQQNAAQRWQQIKPAFFGLLDKKKELARLKAREKWRKEAVAVLEKVFTEKGKLAAALKTGQPTAEEIDQAVGAYDQTLSRAVGTARDVLQRVQAQAQALQKAVKTVTDGFDRTGRLRTEALPPQVQAALQQTASAAETVRAALRQQEILQSALQAIESAPAPFAELPAVEELNRQARSVEEKIDSFAADEELAGRTEDIRRRLKSIGETIEREFEKEKVLFEELSKWVELRARRDAIAAHLEALRQMAGAESEAAGPPGQEPAQPE